MSEGSNLSRVVIILVLGGTFGCSYGSSTEPPAAPVEEMIEAINAGDTSRLHQLLEEEPTLANAALYDSPMIAWAADEGQSEIVAILIDYGANVDKGTIHKVTALHRAAGGGHTEMVQLLIAKGANPEAKAIGRKYSTGKRFEYTPLEKAAKGGHHRIGEMLLAAGAKHNIATASAFGDVDALRKMTIDSENVNARHPMLFTPLSAAAKWGHIETMRLLIDKGAVVNHPKYRSASALSLASESGHLAAVRFLLDRGANPNIVKDWWTPLHGAAENGHLEVVKLLVERGADVNILDMERNTASGLAWMNKHRVVARYLEAHPFHEGPTIFSIPGWTADRRVIGLQLSTFFGLVRGPFTGIQIGGMILNVEGPLKGLQLGGIGAHTLDVQGMQICLIEANAEEELYGLQIASLRSHANRLKGVQASFMITSAGDANGVQIGLRNTATDLAGIQLGVCNLSQRTYSWMKREGAGRVRGVQISLWNECDDLSGVQIGLINISRNHRWPVIPFINIRTGSDNDTN